MKTDPDSGLAVELSEEELPPGRDVFSFGAAECAGGVCVRDCAAPAGGGGPAMGYCSRPCTPWWGCQSQDPARPLVCREALLDARTLAELCSRSPDSCAQVGGAPSAYLCIAPR